MCETRFRRLIAANTSVWCRMFVRDCIYTTLAARLNALRHVLRSVLYETSPVTRTAADVPSAMNGAKRSTLRRAGSGPGPGPSTCRPLAPASSRLDRHPVMLGDCRKTYATTQLWMNDEHRAFVAAVCCMQIDSESLRDLSEPQAVASTLSPTHNLSLRASCSVDQLFDSDTSTTIPRDMLRRCLKCFQ